MARERMTGVKAIRLTIKRVELSPRQFFYRTGKTWEIWQGESNARRVKRIPRVAVLEVFIQKARGVKRRDRLR